MQSELPDASAVAPASPAVVTIIGLPGPLAFEDLVTTQEATPAPALDRICNADPDYWSRS